jgi:hypothetical protein
MRHDYRLAALVVCMLTLSGCSIQHTETVPAASRVLTPPPGASLIFFVRPERFGGSDICFLWDDAWYVGTLKEDEHIAYVTKPGLHLFAVTSEAADFMEAELLPDRTYYAIVRRRFGLVHERFSFIPAADTEKIREAKKIVAGTPQVRPNQKGLAWERGKRETHARLRMRFFPMWEGKSERIGLPASAGE